MHKKYIEERWLFYIGKCSGYIIIVSGKKNLLSGKRMKWSNVVFLYEYHCEWKILKNKVNMIVVYLSVDVGVLGIPRKVR